MKKSKIGLALPLIFPVFLATLLQLLLPACSSTETVVEQPASKPIREHEEDFDPVEYRKPKPEAEEPQKPVAESKQQPETVWVERTEKSMGFRVQLYSTTNIDEAQRSLSQLRSHFDSLEIDPGRIDIGYDAPYYKIRAGDFLNKIMADELREQLREAGVLEAWVVRDMVIRIIREEKKD